MSTEYIENVNNFLKSIEDKVEYIDHVEIYIHNLEFRLMSNDYLEAPRRKMLEEEVSHWSIKMKRELKLKSLGI
jgi:flagellar biosynthesis chaperone FliJ